MTVNVRTSSGLKDIGEVWLRTSGGLKQIGEIWVRTAAGLKQVFGSFSASAIPGDVYGYTSSHAPVTVSTSSTTVTVSPPGAATYSWAAADPGWTAISPTSATTAFRYAGLGPDQTESTVFTCTVTRGAATIPVDVSAQVTNLGT